MRIAMIALAAAALGSAGCATCLQDRCIDTSLVVAVTDAATGAALENAEIVVTRDGTSVGDAVISDGAGVWRVYGGKGRFEVTVKAAGYLDASFPVDVPEDECGTPVAQRRNVELEKTGSSHQALVGTAAGPANCGQE